MPDYTSATKRLCAICVEIDSAATTRGGSTPLRDVLVAHKLVDAGDEADGHAVYTDLLLLAQRAHAEVLQLFPYVYPGAAAPFITEEPPAVALAHVVERFQVNSIHSSVSAFTGLPLGTLLTLGDVVTHHRVEELASQELLERLRGMLDKASADVLSSDLDPRFKERFLQAVDQIRRALATYRVHGAEGVDQAVGELLVVVAKEMHAASPEARTGLAKALETGASIATILEWLKLPATAALAAGSDVIQALRLMSGR